MGSHESKMTKRGNLSLPAASRVQMFRFKFNVTILVPSHCVLLANVGEFLVKSSLFVRPRSASTFLECLSFGQLDLLKSGFSRSLIWCHRHISIFGEQEKQKLPQIVFTLIHTSSTLLRCWLTCASCEGSQPMRGQYRGCWPIRSQQTGLYLRGVWGSASLGTLRVLSKTKYLG